MAKKKEEAPDQGQLPGMEDKKDPDIERAARSLWQHRKDRIAAGKEEKEAEERLVDLMLEKGLPQYHYKTLTIFLDTHRKAKVKLNGQDEKEE